MEWFDKGDLDFSRVRTVKLDEYGMEPDSEKECDRYAGLIRSLGGIDLQLLGIGTIMRAKKILVVANGEGKAEIVRQAFSDRLPHTFRHRYYRCITMLFWSRMRLRSAGFPE